MQKTLLLVIQQINLLLCLVNDILELNLIEQGDFKPKVEVFQPANTFQFVIQMF